MSTRAQVRFATREKGQSFAKQPSAIHAQFYVHSDGYPEGLGIEIAESILSNKKIVGWEMESIDAVHSDLEYIYYIWQKPNENVWISIFEGMGNGVDFECTFVGRSDELIGKHKLNTSND